MGPTQKASNKCQRSADSEAKNEQRKQTKNQRQRARPQNSPDEYQRQSTRPQNTSSGGASNNCGNGGTASPGQKELQGTSRGGVRKWQRKDTQTRQDGSIHRGDDGCPRVSASPDAATLGEGRRETRKAAPVGSPRLSLPNSNKGRNKEVDLTEASPSMRKTPCGKRERERERDIKHGFNQSRGSHERRV